MDNFIVSARKYRPQRFDSVVGQGAIVNTLKNAIINKQLAQAYLFCGPRGVGKTTCARIFAKTINCPDISPNGEFCDKCDSCLSFNSGASLNVYELDAASNNSVDDIRALVDQVRFAPQLGEYKVYIIDEVHMLSTAAFNAFLKTLEEPPKHAKFILATTEKHKIIPTILSRCQVFTFNRISTDDISKHLVYLAKSEAVSYEPEAMDVIARKADGGLRDACSMFDQMVAFTENQLTYKKVVENLNVLDHDYYFKIIDAFLVQDLPQVMLTFDEILKKGFDGHNFLIGLGEHLRDILVSQDPQTLGLLEQSENLRQKYLKQAQDCKNMPLLKALSAISKADVNYKSARNQRLLVEITLMQITFLNAAAEVEKKNDSNQQEQLNQTALNTAPRIQAQVTLEPEVKFASKPSVSFSELKIKSSFSLNELHQNNVVTRSESPTNAEKPVSNKEVNLQLVQSFLATYAEEKSNQGFRQVATIFRPAQVEFSHNTVILFINNAVQNEQLLGIKQDFTDDMRKGLCNYSINLEIRLSENETITRAYKPAEIFQAMAEKNPSLKELKKKFDLEIDY
jgi:DNA polymerase III subunit gamma/tau